MPSLSTQADVEQPAIPDASQIKVVVREGLAKGASAAEIKAELVSRFGPEALSIPAAKKRRILLAGLGAVVAVAALVIWSRSRRHSLGQQEAVLASDGTVHSSGHDEA